MKIRLDQVDDPFDWQETLELTAEEVNRPEVIDLGEIACRGRIYTAAESLLIRVSLTYEQTLCCGRCLGSVVMPVSSQVDLIIQIGGQEAGDEERQLQEQDLGVLLLDDPNLETRPILIEQVQLGFPMKPLCKEDCAGLCSSCGADLNAGPCECATRTDPRWGALAGLKQGSSE